MPVGTGKLRANDVGTNEMKGRVGREGEKINS